MATRKTPKKQRASEAYPIAQSIGFLVGVTYRRMQAALERRVADVGLTAGAWFFLRALWEGDGVSQNELARRVNTSAPNAIQAVRKLQSLGFVEVLPDPDDGRRKVLKLTAQGRAMEDKLLARMSVLNKQLLTGLSEHEASELRRLLRQMQANTEALGDE